MKIIYKPAKNTVIVSFASSSDSDVSYCSVENCSSDNSFKTAFETTSELRSSLESSMDYDQNKTLLESKNENSLPGNVNLDNEFSNEYDPAACMLERPKSLSDMHAKLKSTKCNAPEERGKLNVGLDAVLNNTFSIKFLEHLSTDCGKRFEDDLRRESIFQRFDPLLSKDASFVAAPLFDASVQNPVIERNVKTKTTAMNDVSTAPLVEISENLIEMDKMQERIVKNEYTDRTVHCGEVDFINNTMAFEYLEKMCSQNAISKNETFRRDSLFVKFDPLLVVEKEKVEESKVPADIVLKMRDEAKSLKITDNDENLLIFWDEEPAENTLNFEKDETSHSNSIKNDLEKTECNEMNKNKECNLAKRNDDELKLLMLKSQENRLRLEQMNEERQQLIAETTSVDNELKKLSQQKENYEIKIKMVKEAQQRQLTDVNNERCKTLQNLKAAEDVIAELLDHDQKIRESILECKKKESAMRKQVSEMREQLRISVEDFEAFRESCKKEIVECYKACRDDINREKEEIVSLKMTVRKQQVHLETLRKEQEQKVNHAKNLSALVDDFLGKQV
ncbi:Transforming acidic coiled-coil-containing protein 3 [Trichinella pseudospiralis]|uniref:Transforming acidic coiled-coil-containing protein 3 n=2 Tax=Trichinella pseudospiralis TaxID=6337 RepID=A0A0V1K2J2_TRIPS|nr:Transforming acidic coiled-coil-containing protein 3 [Trichinella pseudospiralis]